MKKPKMDKLFIMLFILLPIIFIVGYISISYLSDDYVKIGKDSDGNSIIFYGEEIYYEYSREGGLNSPYLNTNRFQVTTDISGTKIGYSILANFSRKDAFMLEGSNGDVIITIQGFGDTFIWVRQGIVLPGTFEAEIGSIEYKKSSRDNNVSVWVTDESKVTLNDIVDKEDCLTTDEGIEAVGVAYLRLADIKSFEIVMEIFASDTQLYLKYNMEDFEKESYYYLLKEEYKNLFMPYIEDQN